ncbi:HsdM family class I SAM-dependent methyltransferase [Rhodopseudomonas palustris]|uniref:site-specific DNA-methyltransferase (adenine-specific) n=2 Tax=Rhodopseudomonas palustris (strain ATCC BAA-98 / CGA009) TaxID=258594 RepID=Q6NDV8_RHOPA|nr:N-6 DNA methylase [Rhodopseudomonas palustris]OPF89572.1 SAM-dependent methyltransferase [Rhodopseudomonas palustris]RJF69538.1 SAM-dependent methyltransferase [Rhodopseudomonas palustris]WAB80244.1 N-6 DNA methylase [Rhodopseudomonas palustris]WND54137.1 SAM-dependent methyltransferase [Rhodopseudomonas palustris]
MTATTRKSPTSFPRGRRLGPLVPDAPVSLQAGRVMAEAWSAQLPEQRRQHAAWSFVTEAVRSYAQAAGETLGCSLNISPVTVALTYNLNTSAAELARTLGRAACSLPIDDACYQLSACYTAMLPPALRSSQGAYYTPPALTERLLQLAEEAGVDWRTARVLDPACGGGAFLVPVAARMRRALGAIEPGRILDHFAKSLQGFEIDPFAAWLTQAWLEIAFAPELRATKRRFPAVVQVCDSLDQVLGNDRQAFDLVIGNPPYGRLKLPPAQRLRYRRSLYGHANLYGVFTDLALRWTKVGGVIAYVTPTSFFAGEYFKALRALLAREAPPLSIDFITARKGVFEGVLQEAMLATYRRGGDAAAATVHYLTLNQNGSATPDHAGIFHLPTEAAEPWLAPRTPAQQALVTRLAAMPDRLADWGYKVSTGPLVWNRFKPQLRNRPSRDVLPLIWAEAVTSDGRFIFRAQKKNHQPYFKPGPADDWLKVSTACVLVQRTTAKEQARRLIAAELPAAFIKEHGSVIVENHLNMVKPLSGKPRISPATLAAVLNSEIADQVFRCISGSVAVSAFELQALPLPNVESMAPIENLVKRKAPAAAIHEALRRLYFGDPQT